MIAKRLGVLLLALNSCASDDGIREISASALENAHELIPGLYAGGEPAGEAGFLQLKALGVRTIISVDGAKPDVEAARRQGLRYVHLPVGYDGIPNDRALTIAKAIQDLPGPIYLHCHHGRHRAPAAAAVACVMTERITNEQAIRFMKRMGTGEQYLGLWDAALRALPAGPENIRNASGKFPEASPVPPLADAMVELDHTYEHLGLCRAAGWKKPSAHPDLDPAHEALRAREILTEFQRTDAYPGRPVIFKSQFEAARKAAEDLEAQLRSGSGAVAESAYARLGASCKDCHSSYRNGPR